jgi:hypothetical protein
VNCHLEEGHLATRPVEKGHLEESGLNPPTMAVQRRSEFISICRRAAQAKGINNHIYSSESLQDEEEPQLERVATRCNTSGVMEIKNLSCHHIAPQSIHD